MRVTTTSIAALAAALLAGNVIAADIYPNKPVRIVTAQPGGGVDYTARVLGQGLAAKYGQSFVIENRGGAATIPAQNVSFAAADGYTLLVHNSTIWTAPLFETLPEYMADLTPVVLASRSPNLLVVNPNVAARSVQELIALAKANPGKFQYASTGIAGMHHFGGELFKRTAGIDLGHVAYKGGGASSFAVLAGEVPMMFSTMPLGLPFVRTDKLRALGVGGATRSPLLPNVPTLAEGGARGYEFTVWWGLVAPAQTPETATLGVEGVPGARP